MRYALINLRKLIEDHNIVLTQWNFKSHTISLEVMRSCCMINQIIQHLYEERLLSRLTYRLFKFRRT
jgi:hypothetical protein